MLILLPISISVICLSIVSALSEKNYRKLLENTYSYKLEAIFRENELAIEKIIQSIPPLSKENDFLQLITDNSADASFTNISNTTEALRVIKENNKYIDSIALINRTTHMVYSTNGNSTTEQYFYEEFHYNNYNLSYWKNYKAPLSKYQILPPTAVMEYNTPKTIMPIVFTQVGDIKFPHLVIVNINIENVLELTQQQVLTPKSTFLFINKKDSQAFAPVSYKSEINNSSFFEKVADDTISIFNFKDNDNKKQLVVAYSSSRSLSGYCFAVMVPYSDISKQSGGFRLALIILVCIAVLTTLAAAYMSTKRIYSPLEKIAGLFGKSRTDSDTFQYIYKSVQETLDSNQSLRDEYSMTLPYAQEKYLINILNSNEYYSESSKNLKDDILSFEYDYFCSIVIKIRPTDEFYTSYSNIEYCSVQTGIYSVIQTMFSDNFKSYIIPSETDTLYVLLNLPSGDMQGEIEKTIKDFRSLMLPDKKLINLYIGMGNIYSGIDGLKKSHIDAIKALPASFNSDNIRVRVETGENRQSFTLKISDENTLFNYLVVGETSKATEFIEKLFEKADSEEISDYAFKQLSTQLITIIFKAMRAKNLEYDSTGRGDTALIQDIISLNRADCASSITELIQKIAVHTPDINKSCDIKEIAEYINKNYKFDLSRELIAEHFGISPKMLSKMMKQELGTNFVDYLSHLRVEKASHLIHTSDLSIADIYEQTGFNNRTTFIRTFKKETGITPSEYKKKFRKG